MFTAMHFPGAVRVSRTKIVATVGPASESDAMIAALIGAGVDVFRLNMAHSKPADAQERLDRIRRISESLCRPVAVLADLGGPKMRLGEISGDVYECRPEQPITFVRGDADSSSDTLPPDCFTTTCETLVDDLAVGERVMLADGTVTLQVESRTADSVTCRVVQGGVVRSRQGVNLPGTQLRMRTIQPVDMENARWAVRAGIDFLGLSFVRSAEDICELRAILRDEAAKGGAAMGENTTGGDAAHGEGECAGSTSLIPQIIAKIEKPEALEQLDAIVMASDGIMVARGDLGVETDIASIAIVQKRIIALCRRRRRPVIVATQMLESMTSETMPTRAEATDVANAILDGTDAVMLSGETAVGKHPVLVVETMERIAMQTELYTPPSCDTCVPMPVVDDGSAVNGEGNGAVAWIGESVCRAAGQLADEIGAKATLLISYTGRTALAMATQRRQTLTLGLSPTPAVLRRFSLWRGVMPMAADPASGVGSDASPEDLLQEFESAGCAAGFFCAGDRLVLIGGAGDAGQSHRHIYVHEIR